MAALLAQGLAGLSIVQLALYAVLAIGVIAIVVIVVRNSGVAIPPWVYQIFWVVVLIIVAVLAIKFIASL
jgi:hypothetical protein